MDLTRPHLARPVRLLWNFRIWWYGTGDSLEGLLRGSAPTCFTLTVKIKGPGRGRGRVLAVILKVSSGDLCQRLVPGVLSYEQPLIPTERL